MSPCCCKKAAGISPRFDELIAAASPDAPFKLGFFGGTFDPLHVGHLALAQAAYEAFNLDGVLLVPTGLPVRKMASFHASAEHRYAMLQAALAEVPHFDASRIEIDREGATYTIDTLRALAETFSKRAALFFICGSDTTNDLPTWKEAGEIAKLVTVLSAQRAGSEQAVLSQEAAEQKTALQQFTILPFEMPPVAVSSSLVRKRIQEGLAVEDLIPKAVEFYIEKHGLYG